MSSESTVIAGRPWEHKVDVEIDFLFLLGPNDLFVILSCRRKSDVRSAEARTA